MPEGAISLGPWQLAMAAVLVLVAGGVSIALRLGMEKRLFVAASRTVVQLLLVGYVLRFVFDLDTAPAVLGVALLMILAAAVNAVRRSSRTFKGATYAAFGTLVLSALVTTVTVTAFVVRVEPWYEPQYLVPLLGMALGNALTGISLCLDSLLEAFDRGRPGIEADLSLGASAWEAARDPVKEAVRRGLIPIINSMSVAGIVSLPGMMTGQILAGADPVEAVKYQVVVMFLISAATALGCVLLAMAIVRLAFDAAGRLRHDLVVSRRS